MAKKSMGIQALVMGNVVNGVGPAASKIPFNVQCVLTVGQVLQDHAVGNRLTLDVVGFHGALVAIFPIYGADGGRVGAKVQRAVGRLVQACRLTGGDGSM